MLDTASELISHLLEGTVDALDIPDELRAAAVDAYQDVGGWLADHADPGGDGWYVYPQGSFLLGTVVRPDDQDEYDLDAVCRRNIAKQSTTQAMLKAEVGAVLDSYVDVRRWEPFGPDSCEERKRCWTLGYAAPFHLDVLPAIPCTDGSPTGILLTDTTLHYWQYSDPTAYGKWFKASMAEEFVAKRLRLAEAARTEPEAIPDATVKTTLQRVVQILKRHRNVFFSDTLDLRPASILVTTLAAHAYRGEQDLYAATLQAVQLMPGYIEHDGETWIVANPVEPRENFADKWADQPERAARFFSWLHQLDRDLREADARHGLDKVAERLSESFGREPVEKAARRLGEAYRDTRDRNRLGYAAATGALSGTGALAVRRHDFYGHRVEP